MRWRFWERRKPTSPLEFSEEDVDHFRAQIHGVAVKGEREKRSLMMFYLALKEEAALIEKILQDEGLGKYPAYVNQALERFGFGPLKPDPTEKGPYT